MLSLPPPPQKVETKPTPSPSNQIIISKQAMNKQISKTDPSASKSRTTKLVPPNHIISKQVMNKHISAPDPSASKSRNATMLTPTNHIVSKQTMNRQTPAPLPRDAKLRKQALLPPQHGTNPLVWCCAFLCFIFSLLLILTGIGILIVFLVIKPRYPLFDAPGANLNGIYLDSAVYLNGDFVFSANFSNPNHKIDVRFEYVDIELYLSNKLIGTQALEPFSLRRGQAGMATVHMTSSEVFLPLKLSMDLQKQVQRNRVTYNIKGTFKVRTTIGLIHFSYWLYGRCQVVMTSPPNGVLIARRCKTKR